MPNTSGPKEMRRESERFTLSRRDMMLTGVAGTALLLAEGRAAHGAAAPITGTRPDTATQAGLKMLRLYERAVAAMQAPEINYPPQPHSWTFQAYIHGVPANPFDPAMSGGLLTQTDDLRKRIDLIYGTPPAGSPQAAWKQAATACWATCTHESPFFPTWHRWYLHYFERICRKMCKDASFMLPYWNYGSGQNASLQLPPAFMDPRSRLYFDDRGLGFDNPQGTGRQNVAMNNGGYLPFSQVDYMPALGTKALLPADPEPVDPASPQYLAFGFVGRAEVAPHDMVHVNVGGWMGNVPSAAGDPVFYVHHCQIDRLFASWEAQSGATYNWGATDMQPSQQTWNEEPASFVDETNGVVRIKLGGAQNTEDLKYKYDGLVTVPSPAALVAMQAPKAVASSSAFKLVAMKSDRLSVKSGGASVTLAPANAQALAAPNTAPAAGPVILALTGIKLLKRPPAPLNVFINLPQGTSPALNSPYHVGVLNLFGFDLGTGQPMAHGKDHADHMAEPPKMTFDITRVLEKQRAQGLWNGGNVTVTISTIGADTPGSTTYLEIDSISTSP